MTRRFSMVQLPENLKAGGTELAELDGCFSRGDDAVEF